MTTLPDKVPLAAFLLLKPVVAASSPARPPSLGALKPPTPAALPSPGQGPGEASTHPTGAPGRPLRRPPRPSPRLSQRSWRVPRASEGRTTQEFTS